MTQHASNTPNGNDESKERVTQSQQGDISALLDRAIEKEFSVSNTEKFLLDPRKFDTYKRGKTKEIHENIRTHMENISTASKSIWGDVTQEEIMRVATEEEMRERIAEIGKRLVLMRKRTYEKALDRFPDIVKEKNGKDILRQEIAKCNEHELDRYAKPVGMREFIPRIFPSISSPEKRGFDKIFYDRNILSDKNRERLFEIYYDYARYDDVPDATDLEFILSAYREASAKRKKEILSALGVSITIKQAFEYGLIDESFLRELAKENFSEIFTDLNQDQQRRFIRDLSREERHEILASDFTEGGLEKLLSSEKEKQKFLKGISSIDLEDGLERKEKTHGEGKGFASYADFIDKVIQHLEKKGMKNLELLKKEKAIIRFRDPQHGVQFVQLEEFGTKEKPLEIRNGTENGVRLIKLPVMDGQLHTGGIFERTYEELENFLLNSREIAIFAESEFEKAALTKKMDEIGHDGKIYDARRVMSEEVTVGNFPEKIDILDSEGRTYGFGKGTCFISPSQDQDGKMESHDIWMLDSNPLEGEKVKLIDSNGAQVDEEYSLVDLYRTFKGSSSFSRIAKIASDDDMVKELQGESGVDHQAKLQNGKLIVEEDDGHGHKGKKEISCFTSEKKGHIRVNFINRGMVQFGEYSEEVEKSKMRAHVKKNGLDKIAMSYYQPRTMSYPAFLEYLEKNQLKASDDPLIEKTKGHHSHEHIHDHGHLEGSFLKRLMKWQNPASIVKGIEMIYHGIEHTLEKGAKLDAAKFAMSTSKLLNLPDSVAAQIYADIVDGSKEIIEKYEKKIFGLPGPRGREKCIHIAHNRDSRPEEVVSAINYMMKSYGHLYGEDAKQYQSEVTEYNINTAVPGYFAFFDAFIMSTKLPGGGLVEWRKKAYTKARSEMGNDEKHEGEPTEEQLLHALFKTIDGNWDQYPYVAGVVKALGGPSGFEKMWKFEGYENAYKKGLDQTQMVNPQGRLNKAIGYLTTHEMYKAVGAMEAMAAKVKSPEYQAVPFVWAVGGYSRFASHAALQKIKGYAENGLSFHAYSFLRNKERNDIYRDTVRLALEELIRQKKIPSSALMEFNGLTDRLKDGPESTKITDEKYGKESPPMGLMKFWQKYQARGLHDILQGQNGWLVRNQEKNSTVKEYLGTIYSGHEMQLKDDTIPSGTNFGPDWFKEHGYQNIILRGGEGENAGLVSLDSMLNKITFEGTSPGGARQMKDEHYKKIWYYLVRYMKTGLREKEMFGDDAEGQALQKRQYLAHRKEILKYFAQKMSTRMDRAGDSSEISQVNMQKVIRTYQYYQDLADMGISPEAVFSEEKERDLADPDFQNWKEGKRAGSFSYREIPDLEHMIQQRSNEAITTPNIPTQPKAGPRRKKTGWDADFIVDDDKRFPAGAADASSPS